MTRREDWFVRLSGFLAVAERCAFVPGQFDCALFAAGAVEAMTGVDLAAHWRGRYRSLRGGLRVLRSEGYRDHIDLVRAHFPPIAPSMAGVGDLGVIETDSGPALGLVLGPLVAVLKVGGGLDRVPLTRLEGAFRI